MEKRKGTTPCPSVTMRQESHQCVLEMIRPQKVRLAIKIQNFNTRHLYSIVLENNNHNIKCCRECKTEVYDANKNTWISKDKDARKLVCYFPNTWTKQDTVNHLQTMYKDACFQKILSNKDDTVKDLEICYRPDYLLGKRWNVWLYLSERSDKNKIDRPITTAFLQERKVDDGCKADITCPRLQKEKAEF